jgi:hypothetical protein
MDEERFGAVESEVKLLFAQREKTSGLNVSNKRNLLTQRQVHYLIKAVGDQID